ncbi:MAG: RagB/SusD family nutrient uptake outer membrane protein, partial [Bacteroidales bacterium]
VFTYMNFKFKNNAQPGVGHLNHFRSSEMYLIEAEADYHLSKTSEAQALLNELTCKSGRDASYKCTATGTALLSEIKFYRKIELWGEGFNWFDLKRWGDAVVRNSPDNGGNFL